MPMWPSGLSSRVPYAVERGTLSGWGSNLSPGTSATKELFQIIPMYMMDTRAGKRGFSGVFYKL